MNNIEPWMIECRDSRIKELEAEVERLRRELDSRIAYQERISEAHGYTYNGAGPMDPGPDEDDFDIWAVKELKSENTRLREALGNAIEKADAWHDDSTGQGACPGLESERGLLRGEGE